MRSTCCLRVSGSGLDGRRREELNQNRDSEFQDHQRKYLHPHLKVGEKIRHWLAMVSQLGRSKIAVAILNLFYGICNKPHLKVGERSMGMGSGVGGGGVGATAGVGAGSAALAVEAAAAGSMASSSSAGSGGKGISPAQSAGGAGGLIRLRRGQQTDRRK